MGTIIGADQFEEVNSMKKKNIILGVVAFLIVFSGVWIFTRPEALGNMTQAFQEPTTNSSNISFPGEVNERIKFSFKSNVASGELSIVLYDSNGNVVYELDRAKALETYFTFEKTDIYTLKAEYVDFVGNYQIAVYEAD